VDGGAAANDLLMQFQADLLGIPVHRAAVLESDGAGAPTWQAWRRASGNSVNEMPPCARGRVPSRVRTGRKWPVLWAVARGRGARQEERLAAPGM